MPFSVLMRVEETWKRSEYPSTEEWGETQGWTHNCNQNADFLSAGRGFVRHTLPPSGAWDDVYNASYSPLRVANPWHTEVSPNEIPFLIWDGVRIINSKVNHIRTSLVAQWLRICLPMQGTQVWSLVLEDPTCRGATKPVCHNYWACMPQLLKPMCLEPVLCKERSHCNEKPTHHNEV